MSNLDNGADMYQLVLCVLNKSDCTRIYLTQLVKYSDNIYKVWSISTRYGRKCYASETSKDKNVG